MKDVIIKTESLSNSYITKSSRTDVINNMNLGIYRGDFTVIMGSSGAGKSTLLYMLSTMDKCTSGKVYLLGEDITNKTEKQILKIRRNKISFIFQGINLLNDLSVIENITYVGYSKFKNKKKVYAEAKDLLNKFGLENEANKATSEISGGQKQRVAIARVQINPPEIVFADEPTGALNSSAGKMVLDLLAQLNEKGQSIVMVTHDTKAAVRANRIIYIKDGAIGGELSLDKYDPSKVIEREKAIQAFLTERNW